MEALNWTKGATQSYLITHREWIRVIWNIYWTNKYVILHLKFATQNFKWRIIVHWKWNFNTKRNAYHTNVNKTDDFFHLKSEFLKGFLLLKFTLPFILLMIKMLIISVIYISNLIAYKTVFLLQQFSTIKTVGYKRTQKKKSKSYLRCIIPFFKSTHPHASQIQKRNGNM